MLAAFGPSIAIYITETFRSRIHHIYIRSSSSVITTKAHNTKLDYNFIGFLPNMGEVLLTGIGQGRQPRRKGQGSMDYGTGQGKGNATTRQQKAFGLFLGGKRNGISAMLRVAHRVSHDRHHDDGHLVLAAMEGAGVEEGNEYGSSFTSLLLFSSSAARLLDSSGMS
jgi:hypothetical protein